MRQARQHRRREHDCAVSTDGLSDQEIDQIRRHADAVAHVIVEMFLEQRAVQE
jgi:hypothetical protein